METLVLQEKNRKVIKIFSWILIIISTIVLLGDLSASNGLSAMITLQSITKKFDPPVQINFTLYFTQYAVGLLLCVVIFISATFVLKFRERWRKVLVYGLITAIIFLMISPIINYYNYPVVKVASPSSIPKHWIYLSKASILIRSYFWSIVLSAFFIVVIMRFSKKEVTLLFNQPA